MTLTTTSEAARLRVHADLGPSISATGALRAVDAVFSAVLFQLRAARMSQAVNDIARAALPEMAKGRSEAIESDAVRNATQLWGLGDDPMRLRFSAVLEDFSGTSAALRGALAGAMFVEDRNYPAGIDVLPEDESSLKLESLIYRNPLDVVFLAAFYVALQAAKGTVWVIEKAQDIQKKRLEIQELQLNIQKARAQEPAAGEEGADRGESGKHLDAAHRALLGRSGAEQLGDLEAVVGATVIFYVQAIPPLDALRSSAIVRAARDLEQLPADVRARVTPSDEPDG